MWPSKGPVFWPPVFNFPTGAGVTVNVNGSPDDISAIFVTDRCVMGGDGDWILPEGDQKSFRTVCLPSLVNETGAPKGYMSACL